MIGIDCTLQCNNFFSKLFISIYRKSSKGNSPNPELIAAAKKLYEENPGKWSNYANLNAGRICAIIGTIISGLYMLFLIVYVLFFAAAMSGGFGEFPFEDFR